MIVETTKIVHTSVLRCFRVRTTPYEHRSKNEMTTATGRIALKYTQGSQIVYVDFPSTELRTRVVNLVNAGIDPNTIFAFVGGELDVVQTLQVSLNGTVVT